METVGINGVPLSDALRDKLEHMLGRRISDAEQGGVSDYSAFSVAELSELRSLAEKWGGLLPCIAYIRFRLAGRAGLSEAVSFAESLLKR